MSAINQTPSRPAVNADALTLAGKNIVNLSLWNIADTSRVPIEPNILSFSAEHLLGQDTISPVDRFILRVFTKIVHTVTRPHKYAPS